MKFPLHQILCIQRTVLGGEFISLFFFNMCSWCLFTTSPRWISGSSESMDLLRKSEPSTYFLWSGSTLMQPSALTHRSRHAAWQLCHLIQIHWVVFSQKIYFYTKHINKMKYNLRNQLITFTIKFINQGSLWKCHIWTVNFINIQAVNH